MTTGISGEEARYCPTLDDAGNGTLVLNDLFGSKDGTLDNMEGSDWEANTDIGGVRALRFNDGSSNEQVTTTFADADKPTGDMAIMGFIEGESVSASSSGFGWLGDSGFRGAALTVNNSGTVFFFIPVDANTFVFCSATGHDPNVMTHYAGRFTAGEKIELLRNGVVVAEETEGIPATQYTGNGLTFKIGDRGDSQFRFKGLIDDVIIFSEAVSTADILRQSGKRGRSAGDDAIAITSPTAGTRYQRDGSDQASVTITGTYTDSGAGAIEYRFDGGAWATLVASPSGGTFSQAVTLDKGQGSLEVRLASDNTVTASATLITVTDIFLTAGQSNSRGLGDNHQVYSHASLEPSVFDQDDTAWRDLVDPTDPELDSGSVWPLLATLIMADQGIAPAFITTAQGGTRLVTDWKPTPTTGADYDGAVSRVTTIAPNGIKALLWNQGETDATNSTSQADYNTALDDLAANIQTDTSLSFPMICDLVGHASVSQVTVDDIRKAQIEAWGDNAGIHPGANCITRAGLHWETDAEMATFAALLWVAIDEALYGGPSARGPRLTSALSITGSSTVTLTFDRDLLASDSMYTASAFEVDNDDGAARTISSVTRTGDRTVDIVMSGALDGTAPKVSFAKDLTSAGATVPRTTALSLPATIHSISEVSVPAEPIYDQAVTVTAGIITPTSPVSTDRRIVGTAEDITWTSVGATATVDILLSLDGGSSYPITLASGEANDGTYSWTPTAVHVSANCKVKIVDSGDAAVFGESDAFLTATTSGGVSTDSDEWDLLRQVAVQTGLELTLP